MASGMPVHDNCKAIYEKMRVHKCDDNVSERPRIVTFTIQNDAIIDVDTVITENDLCDCDAFDKFGSLLKEDTCFYFLYDCHYKSKEGITKEDIIFGSWIPDNIAIKKKMQYASSRNAMKGVVKGLKHDMQMNDLAEKGREPFCEKLGKNSVVELEGKCVKR